MNLYYANYKGHVTNEMLNLHYGEKGMFYQSMVDAIKNLKKGRRIYKIVNYAPRCLEDKYTYSEDNVRTHTGVEVLPDNTPYTVGFLVC